MILELSRPIKVAGGEEISRLKLRDYLTAGDVLAAHRAGPSDAVIQVAMLGCRVSGLDMSEYESLDVLDMDRIVAHVGDLQGKRFPEASADGAALSEISQK